MVLAAAKSALSPSTTQPHYHTTTSQHGRWIPFHHSHAQRKLAPSAVAQLLSQHKEGREALQIQLCPQHHSKEYGRHSGGTRWERYLPSSICKTLRRATRHTLCPMCSEPMADLDHIYWKCPQRLITTSPKDRLQARFGWPLNGADLATFTATF